MIAYHTLLITTTISSHAVLAQLGNHIAAGRYSEALSLAECMATTAPDALRRCQLLQCCGDLQLMRGAFVEAEELYKSSLKGIAGASDAEAFSCRSAGLQALFRNRIETAASCFAKVVDGDFSVNLKLEAHVFASQILFETGLRRQAGETVGAMATLAQTNARDDWHAMARLVAEEFSTREQVQGSAELQDDIYWNSFDSGVSPEIPEMAQAGGGSGIDENVSFLLARRRNQLRSALALAKGEISDSAALQEALMFERSLSTQCHHVVVLELTMAALAARRPGIAEILLVGCGPVPGPSTEPGPNPTALHRQHIYCAAKLRLQQGRSDEGMAIFAAYGLCAMQSMKSSYPVARRFTSTPTSDYALVNDDISARLPARYRRAYQYMIAHVHMPSLTVNEIATAVGVTERALQLAFKEHVGVSPREVLRRHRMQKIRDELLEANGLTLMDVASKFGVQNRTSLAVGYRKYFNETPSSTAGMRRPSSSLDEHPA